MATPAAPAQVRGGSTLESVMESTVEPEVSFYEAVGGEETFTRLVTRFYAEVESDPMLRAVYPSRDLGPATEHLRLFLMQYWGGPDTYNQLRGHPRLRMRHRHFSIGEAERDAWLRHMRTALDELGARAGPGRAAVAVPRDGRAQPGEPGAGRRSRHGRPARSGPVARLSADPLTRWGRSSRTPAPG